jgi:hypothetical protein
MQYALPRRCFSTKMPAYNENDRAAYLCIFHAILC